MGKKSGPPAPDYTGAANAQAAQSQANTTQQTWANRPDQTSPFGNITWGAQQVTDPTTGQPVTKWTQDTTLDPELQGALDSQTALTKGRSDLAGSMLGGVQQDLGQPMDYSGFQPLAGGPQATTTQGGNNAFGFGGGNIQSGLDFSGTQGLSTAADQRQRSEDAAYQSQTSRLDPRFAQQQRSIETDLANRGISRNSEAYSRAMNDFNQNKNDAYSQAQLGAINVGGQEAARNYGMDLSTRQQQVGEIGQQGQFGNQAQAQMFGQGLQGAQFGLGQNAQNFGQNLAANNQNYSQQMQTANYQNQLRQQQIAEAQQQRGQGLNEMNALLSGQQVQNPQFQNFGQAGTAQTPDLLGAASAQYGGALNSQSNKNAFTGDILGGLGSMAAMYFSDRRVKRDVRRIGRHAKGFGIYRYRYVGERGTRVGVIAQDVRRYVPEAVMDCGGVLKVNYSILEGLNHG